MSNYIISIEHARQLAGDFKGINWEACARAVNSLADQLEAARAREDTLRRALIHVRDSPEKDRYIDEIVKLALVNTEVRE